MNKLFTTAILLGALMGATLPAQAQNMIGQQRSDLYQSEHDENLNAPTLGQNNVGACDSSCAMGIQNLGPGNDNILTLKPPQQDVSGTQTQTIACADGFTGSLVQQRFVFSNGGYGPWVDTNNSCVCTGTFQQKNINCTPPMSGSIQQQRDFSCTVGAWSGWYNISSTCR